MEVYSPINHGKIISEDYRGKKHSFIFLSNKREGFLGHFNHKDNFKQKT